MRSGRCLCLRIFLAILFFAAACTLNAQRINDDSGTTVDFSRIDTYVRKLPKFATPQLLAKAMAQSAKTDWEKARAIYVWVCENIEYDTAEFFTGKPAAPGQDAFQSGKAVCGGYSDIVTELASYLGLEAVKIPGFSKGFGYTEGSRFSQADHAWNAIKIQGSWRLFDMTWGAGAIDDSNKFIPSFTAAWFAMDPSLFLLTHYPEDPRWMLTAQNINLEKFAALPFVQSYVFEQLYKAGIAAPEQKKFLASNAGSINKDIWRIENMKKAGAGSVDNLTAYTHFAGLGDQEYWKIIHMVERGYAVSELLTIPELPLSDDSFSNVVLLEKYDYSRSALLGFMRQGTMPQAYVAQGLLKIVEVPGAGILKLGNEYRFVVTIEGATKAALVCGEDFYPMAVSGKNFSLTIKPDKGPVAVVANFAGQPENNYAFLLEYEVK